MYFGRKRPSELEVATDTAYTAHIVAYMTMAYIAIRLEHFKYIAQNGPSKLYALNRIEGTDGTDHPP